MECWDWVLDAVENGWLRKRGKQTSKYTKKWKQEHPAAHAQQVAKYRENHKEETLKQWAKDTKAYEERKGHDVIRERNRKAVNAYYQRQKQIRLAQKALLAEKEAEPESLSCGISEED